MFDPRNRETDTQKTARIFVNVIVKVTLIKTTGVYCPLSNNK